jgi:hypothetical protein
MKALAFLIAMMPAIALADVKAGWAFLAAEHRSFPSAKCGKYANAADQPFIAVLADSFGTDKGCLRRFMRKSRGKPTYWQYYAGNGSGRRKRLYSYEFMHRLSIDEYNEKLCSGHRSTKRAVIKQARTLRKRCERAAHEKATCLLSPELESQFTKCALNRWVRYAKRAGWKKEQIVHNPVNIGPFQGRGDAHILERHWLFSRSAPENYHLGIDGACADHCGPCGISGSRVTDNQIVQWLTAHEDREDQFFSLWCPEHQGLYRDSGGAPEPRRRSIRVSESSYGAGNCLIGAVVKRKPCR